MSVNIDEELKRVTSELHEAEDNLLNSGFPEDQWILIRKYLTSAILQNQLTTLKAWQDMPVPNPTS